jgi:hypothetical protein
MRRLCIYLAGYVLGALSVVKVRLGLIFNGSHIAVADMWNSAS